MSRLQKHRRPLVAVVVAVSVGLALAVLVVSLALPGMFAPDANTYLAAGERLNAGHPLYALSPGDRPIDLNPPYWTVPFLSPPFLAVVWRPIALLGEDARVLWWAGSLACLLVAVGVLMGRVPLRTAIALVLLCVPLALSVKFANVNGMLLIAAVAVWWLWTRDRVGVATVVAGLMTGIKLTPAPLVLWLVFLSPRRSIPPLVATAIGLAVVSIVGSSPRDVIAYIDVTLRTVGPGTTEWSIPGLLRSVGASGPLVAAILPATWLASGAALFLLRGRPALGYRVAVATWVLASPVVHGDTLVLLFALLAPSAWQARRPTGDRTGGLVDPDRRGAGSPDQTDELAAPRPLSTGSMAVGSTIRP